MKILVGETRAATYLEQLRTYGWGRMWVERTPSPYDGEPWGFDNGAYAAWRHQRAFPADQFERRLEAALTAVERGRAALPYLAVVPDLVADGARSLEFSLAWIEKLPERWPWYLAVQDGMTPVDVTPEIANFRGILLGGTTRFKSEAARWRSFAHGYGLRFHYARAGTPARLEHALVVEADSLDSAFPLWTHDRFREFVRELQCGERRAQTLPVIREWLATAGLFQAAGDPLSGCTP